jgi:RNA polymerase sigma factor (sigma-70 family)
MLRADFDLILDAARAGADWAWDALYADLAPAVLGYLRAHGAPDPEDLLGEVFLRVVRDVDRFVGTEGGFRAWTFTIARHRLIDARRRARRNQFEPTGTLSDIYETEDGGESDALRDRAGRRALRLISRLTPDQQDVLLLRLLGDLTVEEVARAVGKSSGAVKALQRRGLATLRRELTAEGVTV